MNLITDEMRQLNATLHETNPDYGANNAPRWVPVVKSLVKQYETFDVLDYGCGKGSLSVLLDHYCVKNYDPGMPEFDAEPGPADIVVCTDVMEHVEPECVDTVLAHLQNLTQMVLVLNIALRPASKSLPDGRNAHLIIESFDWWFEKIKAMEFDVHYIHMTAGREVNFILKKRRLDA